MKLVDLLNLNECEVISVVGCNGKTSFIEQLASSLQNKKVLITPTTKIYKPEGGIVKLGEKEAFLHCAQRGIQYLGNYLESSNKLTSLSNCTLGKIIDEYDVVLLEADGSKEKPLKTYLSDEPVIIEQSTTTIGLVNIQVIGKEVKEENIHNYQLFLKRREVNNNLIVVHDVIKMIDEMFAKAKGRKILLVNYYEDKYFDSINELKNSLDSVELLYGNLNNDEWKKLND